MVEQSGERHAMMNRAEISRALAKAIAYKECGKNDEARQWARQLVNLLECAEILAPEAHRCVCGRGFPTNAGRRVHERSCEVERARSDAFVTAITEGRREDIDEDSRAAVAAALAARKG